MNDFKSDLVIVGVTVIPTIPAIILSGALCGILVSFLSFVILKIILYIIKISIKAFAETIELDEEDLDVIFSSKEFNTNMKKVLRKDLEGRL